MNKVQTYYSLYRRIIFFFIFLLLFLFYVSDFPTYTSDNLMLLILVTLSFKVYHLFTLKKYFSPYLLLSSTYFFLLVLGVLLYPFFKEKIFYEEGKSIIYTGFIALILGLEVANKPMQESFFIDLREKQFNMRSIYITVGICFLIVCFLFAKEGIPILSQNINESRYDFLSGNGIYNLFFIGLPVVNFYLLVSGLYGSNKKNIIFSHTLAIINSILLFLSGWRGKTIFFIMEYIGLYFLVSQHVKLKIVHILIGSALGLLFLIGVGSYRRGSFDAEAMTKEFSVLITANPAMVSTIVRNFDTDNLYYGSRYFEDLVKLLPGKQTGSNVDLKNDLFGNADKMTELAGVTPSIVGEAYMNFGYIFIPLLLFLVGFISQRFYNTIQGNTHPGLLILFIIYIFMMVTAIFAGIGTRLPNFIYQIFWVLFGSLVFINKPVRVKK